MEVDKVERILFKGNRSPLTKKYFNKLYELIEQQSDIKVITTPMDLGEIKINSNIINDKSNHWYS
jgi:hypothetical protein